MAGSPEEHGIRGRVWDFDTGELSGPQPVVPARCGPCAHCGYAKGQMLRLEHEGQPISFCDNGECVISVSKVGTFEPVAAYPGFTDIEFIGLVRCSKGHSHVIGGPKGNWALGYCPRCGEGVLAQPDMAFLERAVVVEEVVA